MRNIRFENPMLTRELFGHHNYNLDKSCKAFNVEINTRGNSLWINGTDHNTDLAQKINRTEFIYFSKDDVVRHKLVSSIIEAYEKKQK